MLHVGGLRRVARGVVLLFTLVTLAALIWLSRSRVVLTAGGVYESIDLPIGAGALRWRADQSLVAPVPRLAQMHGPVVRRLRTGLHEVSWYCGNQAQRTTVSADSLAVTCLDRTTVWRWRGVEAPGPDTLPTVGRVAVTSDLEGDTAYFRAWGRALGVLDSAGGWAYGQGHVVILGDATDRGRWVYPLLWTLYRLEAEARAAGGAVHYVLGNHEQYNLVGITKDIEAEHHFAIRQLGTYDGVLDSTTVLGRWLRTRPVALRIGRTLFVHGGVSPEVVRDRLSLDSLNARSRDFLFGRPGTGRSRDWQLGSSSPTQYRGFVMATEEVPRADPAHVEAALRHFDVDRIVVGHTEVDSVSRLHDGRVIDVNATLSDTRALVLADGVAQLVDVGVRRRAWREPAPTVRRFAMTNVNDWRALVGVFRVISR